MHWCRFTAEGMVAGDSLGARDVPGPYTVGRDLTFKSDLLLLMSVLKHTLIHQLKLGATTQHIFSKQGCYFALQGNSRP